MAKRLDRKGSERAGETRGVGSLMSDVRGDVLAGATPEELERFRRAGESRRVYRAWNEVCAGTREGRHVTGLKYLPDTNELLVYLDDASWTQEMTMLREIIRARMDRLGVKLAGFKFRTSKSGYKAPGGAGAARRVAGPLRAGEEDRVPLKPLSAEEERRLDDAVSGIEDEKLAESLKKAMKASLEWKKGCEG